MIKVSLTFLALVVIIDAQSFSYSFEGVHRAVRKSRGGGSSIFMFYCIFTTEMFEGVHEVLPSSPSHPPPLCASMSGMVVVKHFAIQWAMLNWIMDNVINWFKPIIISWLLILVCVCHKVIPLSGFHCN
jgi:hypothetical protein